MKTFSTDTHWKLQSITDVLQILQKNSTLIKILTKSWSNSFEQVSLKMKDLDVLVYLCFATPLNGVNSTTKLKILNQSINIK